MEPFTWLELYTTLLKNQEALQEKQWLLENTVATFVLASNCKSRQNNRMRRSVSRLYPTSVYHKARKKIGIGNKKTKTRPSPVVCWSLPTSDEPNLCNNFISKEPNYIDRFHINFLIQWVFGHLLDPDPLNDANSWEKVAQPSRKPKSVGPNK